jgi:hypothetical protein
MVRLELRTLEGAGMLLTKTPDTLVVWHVPLHRLSLLVAVSAMPCI